MAKKYDHLPERQQKFIKEQKLFFVATATTDSKINLSPKGMDSLRILDDKRIIWLNLTGSGNETATHLLENDRITLMFCAFEGSPMILRVYGKARSYHPRDETYHELISLFPTIAGARQIIDIDVELVQTSCGTAVPYYKFKEDRMQLKEWAEDKSKEDFEAYWEERNTKSLDGKPTGIVL
jgi:hypothetical protein